jgi:hypothetical protein
MTHKIVNAESGALVPLGTMLHTAHPSARPGTWRLENHNVRNGEHVLHVSRSHPRMGRVHREFHPTVFGLTVEIDVVWYRDLRHTGHVCWARCGDWFMAGLVALVPLAFFEHYHMAGSITEIVTFGMFGSGGGH